MFGIGFTEILLILALALIFIGPENLPEIAKALGKLLREFEKAMHEIKTTVAETKPKQEETKKEDMD